MSTPFKVAELDPSASETILAIGVQAEKRPSSKALANSGFISDVGSCVERAR